MKSIHKAILLAGVLPTCTLPLLMQAQQPPTTFVLQSQMLDRDTPVNDQCDFLLRLWRSPEGTSDQVGQPQLLCGVQLQKGGFRP